MRNRNTSVVSIYNCLFAALMCGAVSMLTSCGPSLKDSDPQQRILAVQETDDSTKLARVVLLDDVQAVRQAALMRLVDPQAIGEELSKIKNDPQLLEVVKNCDISEIRAMALMRLNKPLEHQPLFKALAQRDDSLDVRAAALSKISDQKFLADYGVQTRNDQLRELAFKLLQDENVIMEVLYTPIWYARDHNPLWQHLVSRVSNQVMLAKIAVELNDVLALERISNQKILARVAKDADRHYIASGAVEKIRDPKILEEIAISPDACSSALSAVISRIDNPQLLKKIAFDGSAKAAEYAVEKISDKTQLIQLIREKDDGRRSCALDRLRKVSKKDWSPLGAEYESHSGTRSFAVECLDDVELLKRLMFSEGRGDVQSAIFNRLVQLDGADISFMGRVASSEEIFEDIRIRAIKQISDAGILEDLALNASPKIQLAAIPKVTNETVLAKVAGNPKCELFVRCEAVGHIKSSSLLEKLIIHEIKNDQADAGPNQGSSASSSRAGRKYHYFSSTLVEAALDAVKSEKDKIILSAKYAPYPGARESAARKIDDLVLLAEILRDDPNTMVKAAVVARVEDQDVLRDFVLNQKFDYGLRCCALENLNDQKVFVQLLKRPDEDSTIRRLASKKLTDDQEFLVQLVLSEKEKDYIRENALDNIVSQDDFVLIVKNVKDYSIRLKAIEKVDNPDVLRQIINPEWNNYTKRFINRHIEKLENKK